VLVLLCASLLVGFVMAELLVRLIVPVTRAPANLLMYNSAPFRIDSLGALRYVPNQAIQSAMVFHDEVVFEDRFATNNLGFVDHEDYAAGGRDVSATRRVLLVGDSFTSGMGGGEPWVPKLRESLGGDVYAYNLGVIGAGVQHFEKLIKSFAREIAFTDIVLLPITNDFYRPLWMPVTEGNKIRFCTERERATCSEKPVVSWVIDYRESTEIVPRVRRLRQQEEPEGRGFGPWTERSGSHLLIRISRFLDARTRRGPDPRALEKSLEILADLRAAFPETPIVVAHFPEQVEVSTGQYSVDLRQRVEDLGIRYFPLLTECSWSLSMYYQKEGHPNARGYENVSRCLADHLLAEP
jgi:hypothetical protein